MEDFHVDPQALRFIGAQLHRPECVLCTAAGEVYASDWRGGVSRIDPAGQVTHIGPGARGEDGPIKPNGIALARDGSFLLADLGGQGGVWRLARDGSATPFLREVDGVPLPGCNFVMIDGQERTWITVSTRREPRQLAFRADVADGFIVLVDAHGARIVADGLGFTNECQLDPSGRWMYVNETFGRRLTRFRVGADGALSARETVATFGHGTYPDGLAFDSEGGAWITSVVSNRILRVAPGGSTHLVLEDADPAWLDTCERAYLAGEMGRPHLAEAHGRVLRNLSSLAFGGPERRTAYLGCLLGDRVAWFPAPIAGLAPAHWAWSR